MRYNKPHDKKKNKKKENKHGICDNRKEFYRRFRSLNLHDLMEEVPPNVTDDSCFIDIDAISDGVAMQFDVIKEVKQKKGFWRRLLERVSCFGHSQRYEDKDSWVIINIENIDNGVRYLVDEQSSISTTSSNNSDIITTNNNSF